MEHLSAKTKRKARKPKTCNNDLHEKLEITSHIQTMVAVRRAAAGGKPPEEKPQSETKRSASHFSKNHENSFQKMTKFSEIFEFGAVQSPPNV